jgi:hypothetical protein
MKIIIRIKANKGGNVVLIAGDTLNTKVVPCIHETQYIQLQTDRTVMKPGKIQQQ